MTRLNLCLWGMLVSFLFACSGEMSNKDSTHIVVVGTAINLKSGAAVESNEDIYYLDDMLSWDSNMLNKRVQVEGELFVKIYPATPCPEIGSSDSPPPPPPQRVTAEFMQIIKNPKW